MFFTTWRESKRFKSFVGLVLTLSMFFNLFFPILANAAVTWEGAGSTPSIEDVIGESLASGLYSFGWSIDTDGDTVVVGYPSYNNDAGAAYVLESKALFTVPVDKSN